MTDDQEEYSLVKEMLIVFLSGGSLGVFLLALAIALVEFLKG